MAAIGRSSIRFRGFTLIELVTTIVIIGILSALAAPRFFDTDAFSARGFADELAASLKQAQRIAVASRCAVRFTTSAAGYSARQLNGSNCASGAWTIVVRRGDGKDLAGTPPTGIGLAPGGSTVRTFNIDGTVSADAAFVVAGTFTINVTASSGLVTVQP